jgi:phage shock protein C
MSCRAKPFSLNEERRRFLGVCAGLADYMEVPVVLVRIIVVLACVAWPTLIVVYFIAYWWLKPDNAGKVRTYVSATRTAEHFRSLDYRKPLYRGRDVKIAGVCSGIADYLELRTRTVRVLSLLSFFVFGPFTFFVYGLLWIALEKQPQDYVGFNALRKKARMEERHPGAARSLPADDPLASQPPAQSADADEAIAMSVRECAAVLQTLEGRLRHVEAFITSKKFRLHCEINRI